MCFSFLVAFQRCRSFLLCFPKSKHFGKKVRISALFFSNFPKFPRTVLELICRDSLYKRESPRTVPELSPTVLPFFVVFSFFFCEKDGNNNGVLLILTGEKHVFAHFSGENRKTGFCSLV